MRETVCNKAGVGRCGGAAGEPAQSPEQTGCYRWAAWMRWPPGGVQWPETGVDCLPHSYLCLVVLMQYEDNQSLKK